MNSPCAPAAGWKVMRVHAGDVGQSVPRPCRSTSRQPCDVCLGLQRMHAGKARQGRHLLVDAWGCISWCRSPGDRSRRSRRAPAGPALRIVAAQLALGQFRQVQARLSSRKFLRQRRGGHVADAAEGRSRVPDGAVQKSASHARHLPDDGHRPRPARLAAQLPSRTTECRRHPEAGRPECRVPPALPASAPRRHRTLP